MVVVAAVVVLVVVLVKVVEIVQVKERAKVVATAIQTMLA